MLLHIPLRYAVAFRPEMQSRLNASPDYLGYVNNFYNKKVEYSKEKFWLFCHSTFLSLHQPTDPALDYEAEQIKDEDGNEIRIQDVAKYQERLSEDEKNKPWWTGELTNFDQNPKPNSYKEANDLLLIGTNLADAVPKSATLIYEAFRALHGGIFLDGNREICVYPLRKFLVSLFIHV
ncbi:hypothetical protein PG993_003025 [Apiospora rasikravindrae]|uniref:Uncharacterized protein n=1 Tax=Apiospora rasikravindrae TaxID=990691 RepID=A0ABR1TYC9_9PEZI